MSSWGCPTPGNVTTVRLGDSEAATQPEWQCNGLSPGPRLVTAGVTECCREPYGGQSPGPRHGHVPVTRDRRAR
jgi:hypothetical protein